MHRTMATDTKSSARDFESTNGSPAAADDLIVAVYDELRALAVRYINQEHHPQTLQPTALVNEAYVRLAAGERRLWHDRGHFLAAAAVAMRRILVVHARARLRQKRGRGWNRLPIEVDDLPMAVNMAVNDERVLAVDEALHRLAERDPERARLVELRFFAGQPVEAIAAALGRSPRSVARDWKLAKAWLSRELCEGEVADGARGARGTRVEST
jgi:RNA polymerase sigma factor (TIGR02999 family)